MHSFPTNHEQAPQHFDIDAMLYNVSDCMARAKLSRQISSASTTARGRCDRVSKPSSAGNSPQRRKAFKAYRHSRYRADFSSQEIPLQRRSMMNTCELQRPLATTRPMSWHPSSHGAYHYALNTHKPFVNARYSMIDQQSLATEELATPVMPPNMENNGTPTYMGLDDPCMVYPSSLMGMYYEHPEGLNLDTTYDSCLDFSTSIKHQLTSFEEYQPPPPPPHATQIWTESLAEFPSYTNPPTPDFLPIQHPSTAWTGEMQDPALPYPVRKQSMELVGMGLYDSPSNGVSDTGTSTLQQEALGVESQRQSIGKGLKLEETWQPPEEDEVSSDAGPSEFEAQSFSTPQDVSKLSADSDYLPLQISPEPYEIYGNQSWSHSHQQQTYPHMLADKTGPAMASNFAGLTVDNYGWN